MRIGVEEAVLENLLEQHAQGRLGDALAGVAQAHGLLRLGPVEELERQHLPGAGFAEDLGKARVGAGLEGPPEPVGVVGLLDVVELGRHRAIELRHQPDRRVDPRLGDALLDGAGEQVQ